MKNLVKTITLIKEKNILLILNTIVLSGLLLLLLFEQNIEVSQRKENSLVQKVQNVQTMVVEEEEAPTGIVKEYRFTLAEDLAYDTHLAFYVSHQYVDVYVNDEEVYSLRLSDRIPIIKTTGANWVVIPLYHEDGGKEVRVVLTPVYWNDSGREVDFLIGSDLEIYQSQLRAALPELLLCFINCLTGFLVMSIAVYYLFKKHDSTGLLATGVLSVAVSLWRLCDTAFTPFISKQSGAFCYTVSISMLLVIIVMQCRATKSQFQQKGRQIVGVVSTMAELVFAVQLLMQLSGILDLRETLFVTHSVIVVCVLFVIGITIYEWVHDAKCGKEYRGRYTIWILACGGLADLIMYYVRDTSLELLFIQIAILVFDILEGVRFFRNYTAQEQRLLEKELQLTQSRSITMMRQIRSHFVFNILNAISGMCKYDPKKADETVVQFARYLRSNIDIMQDDVPVAFSVTVRHVEDYVALEKIRFGDKIQFEMDIKETDFLMPPLILQPLVENAIKHGLIPKAGGGTVRLSTRAEENQILVVVEDDGVGFHTENPYRTGAVGLENVRFRLEHMVQGSMIIESKPGKGTKVTITLPRKGIDTCM